MVAKLVKIKEDLTETEYWFGLNTKTEGMKGEEYSEYQMILTSMYSRRDEKYVNVRGVDVLGWIFHVSDVEFIEK